MTKADLHENVVAHLTEVANLRAENMALHSHKAALERELSDARVRIETLERAHCTILERNGWYARAYAAILVRYRVASKTMADGLNEAMQAAAKASMTDDVEETERLITEANKLRPAPDNAPPSEYVPPKHQAN